MASLSNESTPRERLARILTLLRRTRMFWRSAAAIAALGLGISLVVALRSKRAFLRRKLEEAGSQMNAANHALATFLAQHPQFQWGVNDSPYAPSPTPSAPPLPGRAPVAVQAPATGDAALGFLERELARVEL